MTADKLLSLLHGVKRTGPGRYVSLCPAHEDKHPSLAIRELEDGRVLLHDFAGCATSDVLAAVGLTLEDLFPEQHTASGSAKERRPFYAVDILRCIAFEALVVSIAANNVAHGVTLPEADRKRLLVAASRLQAATEIYDE
jgi:hypothetical protein